MLESSDYEFKTTMMNMLRDKNKQNTRIDGNVSREIEILSVKYHAMTLAIILFEKCH